MRSALLLCLLPAVSIAATPVRLDVPDVAELREEDRVNNTTPGTPWRYGVPIAGDMGTEDVGEWSVRSDGAHVWTATFDAPGAVSLKLLFDHLDLPTGAELNVWTDHDADTYTHRYGSFGTRPLRGEQLTVELVSPASIPADLHIESVVYGYRDFAERRHSVVGSSGTCNVNAACEAADGWRAATESAVLVDLGFSVCSGTLVNNTAQDQAPLILTAYHCWAGADVGQWSYWFNYESEGCDNPSSEPATDIIYGSEILAANQGTDMALILMDETVPDDWGAYYAGWDATGRTPDFTAGIHHPAGDIKKFSYDADPPFYDGAYWNVGAWDLGTTEGGSSGSGLYDETGLVIGHLLGGSASCFNTSGGDSYGAVAADWDGGGSPESRLRDHLDPLDIDPGSWPGFGEGGIPVEAAIEIISPADDGTSCGEGGIVRITNNGSDRLNRVDFTVSVDGDERDETWRGGLDFGEFEDVEIDLGVDSGRHEVEVEIIEANREEDPVASNNRDRASFEVIDVEGESLPVSFGFDDGASLDTREDPVAGVTWELVDVPERGLVAGMNNLEVENIDQVDALVLATIEVKGGKPLVEFDVAYAQYGPEYEDGLRVVAINACDGVETVLWEAYGPELSTAPDTEDAFIPTEDQWQTFKVDLADLKGQTVTLELQNVGAWGQWLYVDDVTIRKKKGILGCRCDGGGSPALAWLALPLAILLRRRR